MLTRTCQPPVERAAALGDVDRVARPPRPRLSPAARAHRAFGRRAAEAQISTDASLRDGLCAVAAAVKGADALRCEISRVIACAARADNQLGELQALQLGFELAAGLGLRSVEFRTDSTGAVEWVLAGRPPRAGRATGKPSLAAALRVQLEGEAGWSLRWVPRGQNRRAHKLAGRALRDAFNATPGGI